MSESIKASIVTPLPRLSDYEHLPPDNTFFEDESTGKPRGQSWNFEIEHGNLRFNKVHATIGKIEAGTTATYSIESPEMVLIQKGVMSLTAPISKGLDKGQLLRRKIERNKAIALPPEQEFTLEVLGDEALEYICFFPKLRLLMDIEDVPFPDYGEFATTEAIIELYGGAILHPR